MATPSWPARSLAVASNLHLALYSASTRDPCTRASSSSAPSQAATSRQGGRGIWRTMAGRSTAAPSWSARSPTVAISLHQALVSASTRDPCTRESSSSVESQAVTTRLRRRSIWLTTAGRSMATPSWSAPRRTVTCSLHQELVSTCTRGLCTRAWALSVMSLAATSRQLGSTSFPTTRGPSMASPSWPAWCRAAPRSSSTVTN